MKRILLILLLLLLLIVTGFTMWTKAPQIEAKIEEETYKLLVSSEAGQRVKARASGRELTLSGTVQNQSDIQIIVRSVEDVYGSLEVISELEVLPIVKPYTMKMEKLSNGKVSIVGHAANTSVRDDLIDHANKIFLRNNVKTDIKIAGDMPDTDWPEMVKRGMNGLDGLILGQATLTDRALKVTGTAENITFIDQAREAVTKDIPAAYKDKGELDIAALPPIAKPFLMVISKNLNGQGLVVEGVTPDFDVARKIKENLLNSDSLDAFELIEARGQPDASWGRLAISMSDIPSKLVEGRILMRDNQLFVSGVADSEEDARAIDAQIRQNLPEGYSVQRQISVLPRRVEEPFLSAVKNADGDVDVQATYVDEAEKARIELLFGQSIGSGQTELHLELVRTTVPSTWTSQLASSADILTTLSEGVVASSPKGINASGKTRLSTEDFDNRFAGLKNFTSTVEGTPPVKVEQNDTSNDDSAEQTIVSASASTSVSLPVPTSDTEFEILTFSDDVSQVNGFEVPTVVGELSSNNCVGTLSHLIGKTKINFKQGSAEITDESQDVLNKLAGVLTGCTANLDNKFQIGGHTDSLGQDEDNRVLSLARATSVATALVDRGVPKSTLTAVGFGETLPIANDNTKEGRAQNRRIEFEIIEN